MSKYLLSDSFVKQRMVFAFLTALVTVHGLDRNGVLEYDTYVPDGSEISDINENIYVSKKLPMTDIEQFYAE